MIVMFVIGTFNIRVVFTASSSFFNSASEANTQFRVELRSYLIKSV